MIMFSLFCTSKGLQRDNISEKANKTAKKKKTRQKHITTDKKGKKIKEDI